MTSHDDAAPPPEGPSPQHPQQPAAHPPPYGYWPYPPPPPSRTSPWVWVALGLALALLVPIVALAGLWFSGAWLWSMDDEYYDDEYSSGTQYYVTQRSVDRAMEPACDTLIDAAEEVQLFGSAAAGRASLGQLADAARGISTAIDGANPDADAAQLSTDWSSLAVALDGYAAELDDPSSRFTMPEVDGDYVSDRITWGNDVCFVPTVVVALDPSASSGPSGLFMGDRYAY